MTQKRRCLTCHLGTGLAVFLLAMTLGTMPALADDLGAESPSSLDQQLAVVAAEPTDGSDVTEGVVADATEPTDGEGEADPAVAVADVDALPANDVSTGAEGQQADLEHQPDGTDTTDDQGAVAPVDEELPGNQAETQTNEPSNVGEEVLTAPAEPAEPAKVPGELDPSSYDASKLLEDGGVYSFAPNGTTLVVSNVSDDARLADRSNYTSGYWLVKNLGSGLYTFESVETGKQLSVDDPVRLGNVSVNGPATNWLLVKCEDGSISLVPQGYDGLRLDIYSGKLVAGANIQLYTANGTAAQRFKFTKQAPMTEAVAAGKTVAPGIVSITCSDATGKSIDIKGGSVANAANTQIYNSNGSLSQRFNLVYKGHGLYAIQVVNSGKYLDVANGSTKAGANVQQYQGNNSLAQYWYLKKSGSSYVICNAKSGLALDRYLARTANGTNVHVWNQNGSKAQTFKVTADNVLNESSKIGRVYKDGIYTIGSSLGSSIVVEVASGKLDNGANVQIWTSNGSLAQKWELTYIGAGLYTLQVAHSGKYLTADGTVKGSNVVQKANNASRAEMWYFIKSGSGYAIKNSYSGLVVDIANGKSAKGTNVQSWTSNGSTAQRFVLSKVALLGNGTYVFSSALSPAQLIEVAGASTGNSANVQVSRMRKSTGQQWTITYLGDGAYRFANKNSGLVLDVANGSTASGANVRQYRSNGTDAQKWEFRIADNGGLMILNVKSGMYLDLKGGKASNGTNVQQYKGNGSAAQTFIPYTTSSSFVKNGKTGYQNPSQYYQLSAYNCVLPSYANGFYTYVMNSRISPTATRSQCVEAFIQAAYEYLGTPYIWDWAMAPGQGVDCAGLVMQCLYAVGMQTPYNTYDHIHDPWQDHNAENMRADTKFKQIPFSQRQRGDLIFYAGHVGIYLGNNQIINAYPPDVHIQSVFSWTVTGCSRVFV